MNKVLIGVAGLLVAALPVRLALVAREKAAEQERAERFADDQSRIYRAALAEMRADQRRQAENEKVMEEVREGSERIKQMAEEAQRKLEQVRE